MADQAAAVVLAAGESKRLGQPKQLVELDGEPLLCRIVRLALEAGCSPVMVVLGSSEQPCRDALSDLPAARQSAGKVHIVVNPDWGEGMSSSLRAGLVALRTPTLRFDAGEGGAPLAQSVLVLVSDQVRLTVESLQKLLRKHAETQSPATAARYQGHLGVPAIFRRELLPALAALTGDQGARSLLKQWADRAAFVDLPEAAFEVDTPQDLAALEAIETCEPAKAGSFVVLTGASGGGKTTLALAVKELRPACNVLLFDSIGVPSTEEMEAFGIDHQPGGAWQRAMTMQWIERIVPMLQSGRSVLFEGQMRIAFIQEALLTQGVRDARIILVDCDAETRRGRLSHDRGQPELADESMMGWGRYLREEALQAGCEVLDTGMVSLAESVERIASYLD